MIDNNGTIPPETTEAHEESRWSHYRLQIMVASAIVIALIMTVISMAVYNWSGAAQLDLSRPGYESVSDQVDKETSITEYSASGPLTEETIQEFLELYTQQAEKATAVDAFNGDPLNPEVLLADPADR
ncbi:MAG TPA: hypothetical protein PLY16_03255 [Candidatus Saccharibacteria bacterium]|nr:hypothetical protein [Candidatus Saccharibacteria bacterium]